MTFPAKFMKLQELAKIGFPKQVLYRIFNEKGQKIAFKMNPAGKNSPIVFDTDALAEKLEREIRMERSMRV